MPLLEFGIRSRDVGLLTSGSLACEILTFFLLSRFLVLQSLPAQRRS